MQEALTWSLKTKTRAARKIVTTIQLSISIVSIAAKLCSSYPTHEKLLQVLPESLSRFTVWFPY